MSTELIRYQNVEVIEPEEYQPRRPVNPFAVIFEEGFRRAHSQEHRLLLSKWLMVRNEWLDSKTAISGSQSTRRTYITALDTFWMFVKSDPLMVMDERRRIAYMQDLANRQVLPDEYKDPWKVAAADAIEYRLWLEDSGHSVATTAHYMAVASSFFQYVIERSDVNPNTGIEMTLFLDARGAARSNPFRNRAVSRPKVNPYNKARPIAKGDAQRFFDAIKADHRPLVRARDMALFKAYILTGRRASEVVEMRWGDIEEIEPGKWQFRYVGKGKGKGKGDDAQWKRQPLPADVYYGIVGYLKEDGRWPHIGKDEFIWRPISDDGCANFANVDADGLAENRHIAARRVGQLMDKIAARAGLERMHPHQLRHTFAHGLYEATNDIRLVQTLLGHEHVNTTQIYLGAMETKADNYSQALISQLGLTF